MSREFFEVVKKAEFLLNRDEKKSLIFLTIGMLFMAMVEVFGIVSILPFIGIISNPEIINTNYYINWLFLNLDFNSEQSFIVFFGLVSFMILLTSNIVRIVVTKKIYQFSWDLNYDLSYRLLNAYLSNEYSFFLKRNSTELTKNTITETYQVITGVYIPLINILSRGIIAFFIVALLVVVDPFVASLIGIVVIGGYMAIYGVLKKKIALQGQARTEAHEKRFKAIFEIIRGIKEIRLMGKEELFLKNFSKPSREYSTVLADNLYLQEIPRYAMEILAIGGVMLVIIVTLFTSGDAKNVIPIASLYAFAGYRLMPSLQAIFRSITLIKFNLKPLDILYDDLKNHKRDWHKTMPEKRSEPMPFVKSIEIDKISFSYEGSDTLVLKDFSLTIDAGQSLAIKGTTGSGKTTLVDILLGLLEPNNGTIIIDGVSLTKENRHLWQQNIAYVPQTIYLIDDTLAANIAFGDDKIDVEKVEWAAKLACLDDVIENLENGYDTIVGEDGVRLSGGQRQRIGIARALYRQPKLLVLDEATSALDESTEKKVMDAIYQYSENCTVVMIAHRLSTVEQADRVIDLTNPDK
jgi:ABC-type multidrug transport system fused ATPase/permease subunit